jgi:hypothetical protein
VQWFSYDSLEGLQFAAACGEIMWIVDGGMEQSVREHLATHAPLLADNQEFITSWAYQISKQAPDGARSWPRLVHEAAGARVLGEITREADESFVDRLVAAGAQSLPHEMIYPRYSSWARIEPGQSLRLDRDEAHLVYVPHLAVASYEDDAIVETRLTWTAAALREARFATLSRRAQYYLGELIGQTLPAPTPDAGPWESSGALTSPIVTVSVARTGRPATTRTLMLRELIDGSIDAELLQSDDAETLFVTLNQREHALAAASEGAPLRVTLEHARVEAWPATRSELDPAAWQETPFGWWSLQTAIDRSLQAAYHACETLELELVFPGDALDESFATRRALQQQAGEQWSALNREAIVYSALLDRAVLERCDRVERRARVRRETPVSAPFSERGSLLLWGEYEACQALLLELELLEAPLQADDRWGREQPAHEDYAGGASPALPDGNMVLHGMTGVSSRGQAYSRLLRIIESGGLLAVSERRRRGFGSTTMSPLGDMASGVDWGVPCTINHRPSYGKYVFFALKPSVLARRDLWFSDQDFGGGQCRYDFYQEYARSIGQERTFLPCPPEAREEHLARSWELSHNEVWFRGTVSWDEIDTVFVSNSNRLYEHARAAIETAQAAGDVPEHVRVVSFDDRRVGENRYEEVEHARSFQFQIAARARAITPVVTENPMLAALEELQTQEDAAAAAQTQTVAEAAAGAFLPTASEATESFTWDDDTWGKSSSAAAMGQTKQQWSVDWENLVQPNDSEATKQALKEALAALQQHGGFEK